MGRARESPRETNCYKPMNCHAVTGGMDGKLYFKTVLRLQSANTQQGYGLRISEPLVAVINSQPRDDKTASPWIG